MKCGLPWLWHWRHMIASLPFVMGSRMRDFSSTTMAYFAARGPLLMHVLIWISARNRSSGALEEIGFWTGADHQLFAIGGQTRTYYGAGSMLAVDPLKWRAGLQVRTQRVTFSQVAPEVQEVIRGYDPRHAPVEMHRALCDPLSEGLIDEPHLLMRGYIDKVSLTTPAKGQSGDVAVEIATSGRALTRPLNRYRSDATLKARQPTDTFRKYASTTDKVEVPWGKNK